MPTMSDAALLMTVEDLIAIAMGPAKHNKVNFKQLEMILLIFASQLRVLDKEVKVCLESRERRRDTFADDGIADLGDPIETYANRKVRTKRIGSIDVVTVSEFNLLKNHVMKMKELVGPIAMPTMPDNSALMSGIIGGMVNLPDTMDAMQVKSRIAATEEMVFRMSNILTTLAGTGVLPKEVSDLIASTAAAIKSSPSFGKPKDEGLMHERSTDMHSAYLTEGVTQSELEKAVEDLKAELKAIIDSSKSGAHTAMEKSFIKSEEVRLKMARTVNMTDRLDTLHEVVHSYISQLDGLEGGITKQVQDCKVEVDRLQSELDKGIKEFNQAIANPETLAVKELTRHYMGLMSDLENMSYEHKAEITKQKSLNHELLRLMEAINVLQDQKSDRDEMLDALQDKADKDLLRGMVSQEEFDEVREHIEGRLILSDNTFVRQDKIWKSAIKDFQDVIDTKCSLVELLRSKEEATERMIKMEETLYCLAMAVGEPATAILTKQLSENAYCGECGHKAKMLVTPVLYHQPPFPSPRPRTEGSDSDEDPCLKLKYPPLPDDRPHLCHRYVGGSHTLLKSVIRQSADHDDDFAMRHYTEIAPDGKSYFMSEWLQPCRQCSTIFEVDCEECSNTSN